MTEYELLEVLNAGMSNLIASQGIFITILSAYVVMAYTAGRKLTVFQAGFVSFMFLTFSFVISSGFFDLTIEISHYALLLDEARGGSVGVSANGNVGYIFYIGLAIRVFLILGALAFMWSVRHPKIE